MKAARTLALILCIILVSSLFCQARAEYAVAVPSAYEECASELSQSTSYKYYKNENTERYISYRLLHPDYTLDAIITYVNIGLDQLFYTNPVEIAYPHKTNVLVNKYRPLAANFVPWNLEKINSAYSYGTQKLTHYARLAFERLCADAKNFGYPIWAVSSYRTYSKQAELYALFLDPNDPNSAATRELLVARPGYSEHQTGLAVDISRIDTSVTSASINKWMALNAHKYGYIIRYPAGKEGVTGVANEPWHLRYLGVKLATAVYNARCTYDEYYAREIDIPAKSTDVTAIGVTTETNISVDGTSYKLSAYRVLGDTYYKLRDMAIILNGSSKTFDVTWNSVSNRIDLLIGAPYSSDLTLGAFEAGHAVIVKAVKPCLLAGDTPYDLNAYSTGGSTYYKLEEIMRIAGAIVTYDDAGNVSIDTVTTAVSPPTEPPTPIA